MRNIDNTATFEIIDVDKSGGIDSIEFSKHQITHRAKMREQRK